MKERDGYGGCWDGEGIAGARETENGGVVADEIAGKSPSDSNDGPAGRLYTRRVDGWQNRRQRRLLVAVLFP